MLLVAIVQLKRISRSSHRNEAIFAPLPTLRD
jgi:hypothetical protein